MSEASDASQQSIESSETVTSAELPSVADINTVEEQREFLEKLERAGLGTRLKGYLALSGPGWLQSAITLGGGSLASSLYLGVLAGFSLLWLQPFAMILGIVMLSTIGYVTLSTGKKPFQAINEHVNPVLGWGWALSAAAANIVWCLPQYSLANAVLSQNLLPGVLGGEGSLNAGFPEGTWMASNASKLVVSVSILVISTIITWSYDRGGRGLVIYERILKVLVGSIVLSFAGVVIVLGTTGGLDWSAVVAGLLPDFSKFARPAATFQPLLDAIDGPARDFWSSVIVAQQQDVIISAAATAVGINMTFLFPYSLLRKKWSREHRGFLVFDLSTGMFIPYVLATGFVVIAAGSQFHTKPGSGFEFTETDVVVPNNPGFAKDFDRLLTARRSADLDGTEISLPEKKLAATLVSRDAMQLAQALEPLTNRFVADIVFGFGVLAMALSTITILMLISGFVICEMLAMPFGGWTHRMGTLVAGIGGAFGPFIWNKAAFYLAVPTSVFGFVLLPFAYVTFLLLLNQKSLMGDDAPRGFKGLVWNVVAGSAAMIATVGSVYMVWTKTGPVGIAAVGGFVLLAWLVGMNRKNTIRYADSAD